MPEPVLYHIKPTKLIPNSPLPVLHYKGFFTPQDGKVDATAAYDLMKANGWDVQWVAKYGNRQRSHYHPETHECMAVLAGPGRIRWGVADLDDDWEKHTYGDGVEEGCLEMDVDVGDVFVVPAGVAHKNFDPKAANPDAQVLTGDAHSVNAQDPRVAVQSVKVSPFTMIGAYPAGCQWSWAEGGDHLGRFEAVWNTPKPKLDPVVGYQGGIGQHWK